MIGYTDIHSHIIPNVDDGARSKQESLQMIEIAHEEGIRTIIATPHFGLKNDDFDTEKAIRLFGEIKEMAKEDFPDMTLLMGNELYWSKGIIDSLKSGEALTMADTDYVLIEFDEDEAFEEIEDAIDALTWNGYHPIIAHFERYRNLSNRIDLAGRLLDEGAYIQVNCRSFIPRKKKRLFKEKTIFSNRQLWTLKLLNNKMVHFIASDCHDANIRKPIYEKAVQEIRKHEITTGNNEIPNICYNNTERLLQGKTI